MVIAKNKTGLAIVVGVTAMILSAAGMLVAPGYTKFVTVLWLPWLGLAGWLVWSVLAKTVFATEPVAKVEQAFDRFEDSLNNLSKEQSELRINLDTAITKQDVLIELLVGFVNEAANLKERREALKSIGKTTFHDDKLALLLMSLSTEQRKQVVQAESEILEAQANAYLVQAQALLNRVVAARGAIARQQLKFRRTEAAIPLLQMNESLGQCERRLVFELNRMLPEPSSLKRRLPAQN